jgi:hypothetical protein
MNRLLIIAILMLSTAPLYAQGQQQNVAKLKEDARNAVGIIGADRGKTQSYCQIVDLLGRQLGRADQEKNKKKTKALSQRVDQLQKKLGPEFVVLENILTDFTEVARRKMCSGDHDLQCAAVVHGAGNRESFSLVLDVFFA